MGLRFDLSVANWIAFLVEEGAELPEFTSPGLTPGPWASGLAVRTFMEHLRQSLMSSPSGERDFAWRIDRFLERSGYDHKLTPQDLREIRDYFNPRAWTALILPSGGRDVELDRFLCSPNLLRTLVDAGSTDRGLLLQLAAPPTSTFSLTDVFPAFSLALEHRTEWPALLVWTPQREVELFQFDPEEHAALESMLWIMRQLGRESLRRIHREYSQRFPNRTDRRTTIIQISDIHLGSEEANIRLPRLQQHLLGLVDRYRTDSDVLIVVTGDLMDSPDRQHLDRVRSFIQFLSSLPVPPPVLLVGNHDVRRNGYLDEQLSAAMQLPLTGAPFGVRWFDDLGIAIIAVNSVVEGHLATGSVGERQLIDLANHIDQKRGASDFTLVSAIHHHPTPVARPDWYAAPFYERIVGSSFEETDSLSDATAFLQFVREQRIAAVMHGHKHIPRLDTIPNTAVPIVGCGSSVGKVSTRDGTPYLSVNVLTIDRPKGRIAARLLASRTAGGRLNEAVEHQAVLMTTM